MDVKLEVLADSVIDFVVAAAVTDCVVVEIVIVCLSRAIDVDRVVVDVIMVIVVV